jgi:hypothetical protein
VLQPIQVADLRNSGRAEIEGPVCDPVQVGIRVNLRTSAQLRYHDAYPTLRLHDLTTHPRSAMLSWEEEGEGISRSHLDLEGEEAAVLGD